MHHFLGPSVLILSKLDALRIVTLGHCYSSPTVALAFFVSYPEYSISSPTNPLFQNFCQKSLKGRILQ